MFIILALFFFKYVHHMSSSSSSFIIVPLVSFCKKGMFDHVSYQCPSSCSCFSTYGITVIQRLPLFWVFILFSCLCLSMWLCRHCFFYDLFHFWSFSHRFHHIDIVSLLFSYCTSFLPQIHHFVVVVTWFCDLSPYFSSGFSILRVAFFTLFFSYFIMLVVCVLRFMFFTKKVGEVRFDIIIKQFFGAYHHSGTIYGLV